MPKKILFALLIFISLLTGFSIYHFKKSENSIAYVDSQKLFDEFKMTQELKLAGEQELRLKKHQLDSLQIELKNGTDNSTRSVIMQQLINQKQILEEFQARYSQLNSEKIWNRISSYTQDFANSNNFDFIIGSNGKQQLLYGKKSKDVTETLLQYINKRYEGY
jgi:outer membrane protein